MAGTFESVASDRLDAEMTRKLEPAVAASQSMEPASECATVELESGTAVDWAMDEESSEKERIAQEASRLMAKDQRVLEQAACEDLVEMTLDDRVAAVRKMMDAPRFREIYFAVLDFCCEQRTLGQVEQMISALPEFEYCGQNQYRLVVNLESAGALERFELDESGDVVTEEMKKGLTEDEIDDLVLDYAFATTDAGRVVCEEMQPSKRMEELMGMFPKRVKAYCQVLEFCKTPRSFKEIDALLKGSEVLASGSANTITNIPLQPSVFIEQLERSGGLVWKGSWNVTEGGKKYLELIQNLAD